jgi:hypothetical protein
VATDTLHFVHKAELLADSGNERVGPWLGGVGRFGRRLAICKASRDIDETESDCGNNGSHSSSPSKSKRLDYIPLGRRLALLFSCAGIAVWALIVERVQLGMKVYW